MPDVDLDALGLALDAMAAEKEKDIAEAYTAGALAMKEAARTIAQAWIDRGSPDISLLPTAIGSISVSALPVPPRGSKI